mmetsp:Transcript_51347/g.151358  ORF Transcript_51347/g.151358 Transcript_51347/m.151358 type:complete len:217 (-) Transcript_51347:321-971(-)
MKSFLKHPGSPQADQPVTNAPRSKSILRRHTVGCHGTTLTECNRSATRSHAHSLVPHPGYPCSTLSSPEHMRGVRSQRHVVSNAHHLPGPTGGDLRTSTERAARAIERYACELADSVHASRHAHFCRTLAPADRSQSAGARRRRAELCLPPPVGTWRPPHTRAAEQLESCRALAARARRLLWHSLPELSLLLADVIKATLARHAQGTRGLAAIGRR